MRVIGSILIVCAVICGCRRDNGAPRACGSCGGSVELIASVADDTSKPSRNLSVWNRSVCGNILYGEDDVICTQCSHAYSSMLKAWSLSLQDSRGFQKPLASSILDLPLPTGTNVKSSIVYSQECDVSNRTESVAFWCLDDQNYLAKAQAYADEMNLVLKIDRKERFPSQVYLRAKSTKESNK